MLFRECSNFDGQIGHFLTEKLQGKANILLFCVDSKMTCKAQGSNQTTVQYWLFPVLSAAVSKREAIRKMLERDSKNRETFIKMCPLRKGHRKRSLREDMITVLPPQENGNQGR